ncbi:hypothetical protein WDK57_24620, partial [Escherichia coli]
MISLSPPTICNSAHQLTFADSEFSTKRRQTRKEIFLSRMEQILPWQNMV